MNLRLTNTTFGFTVKGPEKDLLYHVEFNNGTAMIYQGQIGTRMKFLAEYRVKGPPSTVKAIYLLKKYIIPVEVLVSSG